MEGLNEYLIPYVISQIVSVIILIVAMKRTKATRILFALLFFSAFCANMYLGLVKPNDYLDYGELAIPLYRDFIYGWFSKYVSILIPIIATGQLLIAIGILLKGFIVKIACIGIILFLLAIAPLMVGSAFPFSITVSIAAFMVLKKKDLNYVWKS
ncbi:hypothetical protein [uncultured Winogradskyella sp.]|uniref:hypothetical protein n=1 Tax=uncultured Winogradskyella sp. TaxID=395353 RepID=UPI0026032B94|nr:hypothetical protein [uncultured Winogradskyella sp.]